MEQAQNLLRKYFKRITYLLGSIYGLYLGYVLLKEFDQSKDLVAFARSVWNYQVYSSGNVSVTLNKILLGITIISLGVYAAKYLSSKFIHSILEKTSLSVSSRATIENLVFYFLCLLFFIMALNFIQVPLTIFTVFGGALAIGVGFGSQNLLKDFISGVILQIEKPVKVGDIVELEDNVTKGVVQDIGTRSTKILMSDNSHVILPNSVLLEKRVTNLTLQDQNIRCRINLTFSKKNNPQEVIDELKKVMISFKDIMDSPEPRVLVTDFTDVGTNYALLFFIRLYSQTDKAQLESNVRVAVYQMMLEKKFEMPYPHRVMISPKE